MPTRSKLLLAAAFVAALLFSSAAGASAAPAPRHVVIVLAPYLTWDDVLHGPMPVTRRIAAQGLVADMNDRSGAGTSVGATPVRGALMLSAGASMIEDPTALSAFDASQVVGGAVASDVYEQLFGSPSGRAAVLYLGLPKQQLVNSADNPGPVAGELGNAVHRLGAITAAVGCSDPGVGVDVTLMSRPAGVTAATGRGRVDLGDVSAALLTTDVTAPFGARTDVTRLRQAYRRALAGLRPSSYAASNAGAPSVPVPVGSPPHERVTAQDVGSLAARPSLIVVDPGDLGRAYAAASLSTTPAAAAQHRRAVAELDRVVSIVSASLARGDTLMIVSQVVPSSANVPDSFAPLIVSGPLGAGLATSASTHRDGIVTLPDVSASVVSAMGEAVPSAIVGSSVERARSLVSSPLAVRVARLEDMANAAVAVETVRLPLVNVYVAIAILILVGCALIVYRGVDGLPQWTGSLSRVLLLLVACIPLAAVVQFALVPDPADPTEVVLLLVSVSAVLLAIVWYGTRGRSVTWPLIVVTGATALLLMVDQWLGAPLSLVSIFGYSPLQGARYYGIGNEMSGLLLGSALVAAALVLDTWRDARWAPAVRKWGWPLLGVVVLGTAAAPTLGANVGPVAWMTVGFLAGWLILNGQRVWTWRNMLIVLALVAVILVGFGVVDVLRGPGSETHLGRLITDIWQSGLGGLWIIFARKAVTNVRVLGKTNWTWLAASVLLLLGYMRWRPRGEFAALLREYPAFSAAVAAALFAGVAGYFTEDSGIIIPALVLLPIGVAALYLMFARSWPKGARE